jgi:Terminase large subunit, T4likevirus-type, N-terminal
MDSATEWALRLDPSKLMEKAALRPDPWQRELLRCEADRVLLLCSRQLGKSTSVAFTALNTAYLNDESLILLSSKTERQAGELFKKITYYHRRLDLVPSTRDMSLTLELANGSRIIALCGEGDNFRGFSDVRLALVDEASIVDDSVLTALLPMLVVSGGRLIALSTPMGKRGWFYERWESGDPTWQRINAKAADSPRIPRARLEQQKRDMGERKYSQEFENVFIEAEGQLFSDETIAAIFDHEGFDGAMPPLLGI